MMARLKRTADINELAKRVLGRADRHGKRAGAAAVGSWNEVAGAEIAKRTRGFALRDGGELVVFVESAAWANQLSLMSQDLLERLNNHLGENQVTSIRFTVSRRAKHDELALQQTGEAPVPAARQHISTPLDETERAQALQVASVIKDEALREAALRAMIKDLEQKKGLRRARPGTGH